jgi:hypothetical protein
MRASFQSEYRGRHYLRLNFCVVTYLGDRRTPGGDPHLLPKSLEIF